MHKDTSSIEFRQELKEEIVNAMSNQEVGHAYRKAVREHQQRYPTFDMEQFDNSVKGYWRMRQVLVDGVAKVNRQFRKNRRFDRCANGN